MKYLSTRGHMAPATFSEILLEGLAPDGGLCVPESYPSLDVEALRGRSYVDVAFAVMSLFAPDLKPAVLKAIIKRSYTAEVFGSEAIVPVSPLPYADHDLHLAHASNGPTLAFKDIAMQLLGHLFEHVLTETGRELNILGATSGDTGSAAEAAMAGKHNMRVFMLSPLGKTSPFQAAQMFSILDANICNIAIRGVFDDCQDLVKLIAGDLEFKRRYHLGAVNSMNWGRIMAQIVYYVTSWLHVTEEYDGPVSFAVPSGNFGNILAGHVARQMGVPIDKLILATNENDVLDEFFTTGVYRVRAAANVYATSSPSMDISKASNFERFIFDVTGRDAEHTRTLFEQVEREGGFDLDGTDALAPYRIVSGRSTHADRIATIRTVHAATGQVIDPHTADGVKVAVESGVKGRIVCIETARPAKFAATIVEALGTSPDRPSAFAGLEGLPQRFEVLDNDAAAVRALVERVIHAGS